MEGAADLDILKVGPRIAIVDDNKNESQSLIDAFAKKHAGVQFFPVDYAVPNFPEETIPSVDMLFMDLHYQEGFGVPFDPYVCIDWIKHIISHGTKYMLIVWSRDIDHTEELIKTMREMDVPMPYLIEQKAKAEYRIGKDEYDAERLLGELVGKVNEISNVVEFDGEILELEEDGVLINCLINEEPKVFEVRRFDIELFNGYEEISLAPGSFVKMKITTKPGSRTIEIYGENANLSERFIKPDIEGHLNGIDWLNTPENEDNV